MSEATATIDGITAPLSEWARRYRAHDALVRALETIRERVRPYLMPEEGSTFDSIDIDARAALRLARRETS